MSNPGQMTFESTLADLATDNYQVSSTTIGQVVAQIFYEHPELPGIMIVEDSQLIGMISRQQFREQTHLIHRKNLYFNHPIQLLLDVIRIPPLQLPQACSIIEAVQQVFRRPKSLIYEPIVIYSAAKTYHLLDVPVLLMAQNQLLSHAHHVIQQQKQQQQQCLRVIQQEKNKHQQTEQYFRSKEHLIHQQASEDYNQQKAEMMKQTKNIIQLNKSFIQIGQQVAVEAGKAFHEIFMGAHVIHQRTHHFVEVRQVMAKHLETINSTSTLMNEIVDKVRHLAVQAAVVSYQNSSSNNELSRVHFEMNRLVGQTMKVKDKIHQSARQIQLLLRELNHVTSNDAQTTRTLLMKVEQTEQVIAKLEKLVYQSRLEQRHLNHNPHAVHLIQAIERALKHRNHQSTRSLP